MSKIYFENEKTGRRYDVVRFNKDEGTVTLKGDMAEFTEKFDKDAFREWGYELKQEN